MTGLTRRRIQRTIRALGIAHKKGGYVYSEEDYPIVDYNEGTSKYGFPLYRLDFLGSGAYDAYRAALTTFEGLNGVDIIERHAIFDRVFSGSFLVMATNDYEEMLRMREEEQNRVEAWWNKYHAADSETRRLMARGEL